MGKLVWIVALVALAVAIYVMYPFDIPDVTIPSTGWWGKGPPQPKQDETIREFKVNISKEVLNDLQQRLQAARLGEDLEGGTFEYGFQVSYMKEILEYWRNKYDWRKQEAKLNSIPQYKTTIEGIEVHFLRAKPKTTSGPLLPLLLVHGWPGSVVEFYSILPILTDPTKYGHTAQEAFEIICPSIPGYGFSEAPHQKGFDHVAAARVFAKLMSRLGHEKFYYQGGDWGAAIGTVLSLIYPERVTGLHLNHAMPELNNPVNLLKHLVLQVWPSLLLDEGELSSFPGTVKYFKNLLRETGYFHLQATRPDTVAYGLNDSPMGLAAYILEKFSVWTTLDSYLLHDGGLTRYFSLDDLLTNVMVYWVTGTIGSSVRFYREVIHSQYMHSLDRIPVTVPTGIAAYHNDTFTSVRTLTSRYVNTIQYTHMDRGGHFAAMQEPQPLADDVFSFVQKVESLLKEQDKENTQRT